MIRRLKAWRQHEDWDDFAALATLAGVTVGVWIFIALLDDAPAGDYLHIETKILRFFRSPADPAVGIGPWWVPEVARDITALGSALVLVVLVALIVGWLLLRARYRTAVFIAVATVGGAGISSGVKSIVERPRPTIVPHLVVEHSHSFPSGHSMLSSVVYLTLGGLLARTMATRRREKIYLIGAAALLTMATGVSRVYLGVHYPTDVLAGWSAGTAWALIWAALAWWLQRRGQLKQPAEEPPDTWKS